ncbi:MAG: hypothetical protein ABJB73_11335 [Candidatus Nitrosocosmicus sp.]
MYKEIIKINTQDNSVDITAYDENEYYQLIDLMYYLDRWREIPY